MMTTSSIIKECTERLSGYEAYLIGKSLEEICNYCKLRTDVSLTNANEYLKTLIKYIEDNESPSPKHPNSGMVGLRNFDSKKGGLL